MDGLGATRPPVACFDIRHIPGNVCEPPVGRGRIHTRPIAHEPCDPGDNVSHVGSIATRIRLAPRIEDSGVCDE
ncbi:MAG: hypothetical protein NVS2B16_10710 [Chloroflexota bacterium]